MTARRSWTATAPDLPRPIVAAGLVASIAAIAAIAPRSMALAQWGMGFNRGGYASTAGQAADYGMSEMMRAQGYQNLENSEAAKNWEQARAANYENRKLWTETYFEMRKMNREARSAENGPPVTQEQAVRLAKMAAPPRLGSTQLDPVTGHIQYPLVLTDDVFAPNREQLDTLFAKRAATGGSIQFQEYQQIEHAIDDFLSALKGRVTKYAAGDYGRAKTFLESLAHELRFPAG